MADTNWFWQQVLVAEKKLAVLRRVKYVAFTSSCGECKVLSEVPGPARQDCCLSRDCLTLVTSSSLARRPRRIIITTTSSNRQTTTHQLYKTSQHSSEPNNPHSRHKPPKQIHSKCPAPPKQTQPQPNPASPQTQKTPANRCNRKSPAHNSRRTMSSKTSP